MNFVAKCCQPPGILGDFAVDRWKFIDFTRPGILRLSPCTDKKWNSPLEGNTLQIEKKVESARNLIAYIYLIMDAQLNIKDGKFDSVVY